MSEPHQSLFSARDVRLISLQRAVALAHAQSGTFEQEANEEIPQTVIQWLYDEKYIATRDDQFGESYVVPTDRGVRLLRALLRGHDVR